MISQLANFSLRRLCIVGALAALTALFVAMAVGYGVYASFLGLLEVMPAKSAAALIAAAGLLMALLCYFIMRLTLATKRPVHVTTHAQPKTNDLGLEMGLLFAEHAQSYVKAKPGTTILAACLAGIAAGAAPDKTADAIKTISRAFSK